MRKKLLIFIPLLIAALVLIAPGASFADPPGEAAPIRLQAATFTPAEGESANLPPGLQIAGYAANQRGYYIVQFAGPVQENWKQAVTSAGGELLEYIPDFAFKVRMNPGQARQVENLDQVAWVGVYQPGYKLAPNLERDGANLYRVRVERGANAGLTQAAIAQTGAQVLARSDNLLLVGADSAQVNAVANVVDVAWIENFAVYEKHNEYGAGVILGANTANANGYDGSTQTVAVADTGLGDGTAQGAHPDIPASRVVSIYNWPGAASGCFQSIDDDGAIDVDSGHGTHVAASVLSDGGVAGEGKGTAPSASLVFQATENWATVSNYCQLFGGYPPAGYFLTGLPDDLRTLYQQAYADGARIHANSWGSAQAGVYTLDSANTDDFIWSNPDMSITFSAGNAGEDANADGVVDNDSIGSPATAKNVLTVGASENDRNGNYQCDTNLTYTSHDSYQSGETCQSMGGNQADFLGTAGSRWGFPAEPLASDVTAGNAEQMAPFSSRGPTDDGRIKPDIVAPGAWILSGFSGLYQEGYGDPLNPKNNAYQYDGWGMPINSAYKYMGGTSMSNPIAAGAAAVVRDFYNKAYTLDASAALVKATLINSAVDMLDENNDGADDNDYPIPNVHEGWGRIDLAAATDGSHDFTEETAGLSTGGGASYAYSVNSGDTFKVTLVWSDYPSTESASQNLVNDLDLVVTSPSGAVYYGNEFSGGWSQTGGSADRTNNVENVYVQAAEGGAWTVDVSGYNVPNGPQPFALVVDGAGSGSSPTATATPTLEPTNTPTPEGPTATPTNTPEPTNTPTPTNTPEPTNTPTATSTPDNSTIHVGDLDGANGNNGSTWTAYVTITIHDASENPVANATVSGDWSNGGSASCTTDASGQCTVSQSGIRKNVGTVDFTVSGVSHTSYTYDATANHDPDGDSNGTTITVSK